MTEIATGTDGVVIAGHSLASEVGVGVLRHGGNAVLRWNAGNLVWRRDVNDGLAPNKIKSTGRIDGMAALVMAIRRAIDKKAPKRSIYEERRPVIV